MCGHGLLESLVNITAWLCAVPDGLKPLPEMEVSRVYPLAAQISVEQSPLGKVPCSGGGDRINALLAGEI
jgi:hypothetical protein